MIDRPSFPVTLAFPPQGHFTQPHLAIPCLVSWLKAAGYDDVDQLDLSVEAYDWFLSKPVLERSRDRVRERLAIDPTNGGDALPFEHVRAFRVAAESAASEAVRRAAARVRRIAARDTMGATSSSRRLGTAARL